MSEPYVGEIRMFAGNFEPAGWAFCDGRLLSISEYDILFMLLGTTYGGDGRNTFALPDLRGRIPLHTGQNPVTRTLYALGQLGGSETVTLNTGQLPAHTHMVSANAAASESVSPQNNLWGSSTTRPYVVGEPNGTMNPAGITPSGGNQPHDNVMPILTTTFIISLFGIYPMQD